MTLLDDLLDSTPSLLPLRPALLRSARSEAPVLVVGESGTGRTSLARAIHSASARAAGPLVEVDPGVVPSTLFESELFGYRAGAFTGAEQSTPGRVERAEGGTLLIDPVEELPLPVQPKLLRLLAERRYSPLGGGEREADVRFVAVGSPELLERVRRGTFREDLFYRLEVLAFRLSPLRERREDVPSLLSALLRDLGARYGKPHLELSAAARSWMYEYPWPGNLREMRNLLERALVLHRSGPLDPEPPREGAGAKPRSLQELEHDAIVRALEYTRGHQGKAAALLGISRKALWEKRKRLGLP